MENENVINIYNRILFRCKQKQKLRSLQESGWTWKTYYIGNSGLDKYHMFSLSHMEILAMSVCRGQEVGKGP